MADVSLRTSLINRTGVHVMDSTADLGERVKCPSFFAIAFFGKLSFGLMLGERRHRSSPNQRHSRLPCK